MSLIPGWGAHRPERGGKMLTFSLCKAFIKYSSLSNPLHIQSKLVSEKASSSAVSEIQIISVCELRVLKWPATAAQATFHFVWSHVATFCCIFGQLNTIPTKPGFANTCEVHSQAWKLDRGLCDFIKSAWQTAMKSNYDVRKINKTKTQFRKFINRFGWNCIIVYGECTLCCPAWTLDKQLNLFHLFCTVSNDQPPNKPLWTRGICSLWEQWRPFPECRWFMELTDFYH